MREAGAAVRCVAADTVLHGKPFCDEVARGGQGDDLAAVVGGCPDFAERGPFIVVAVSGKAEGFYAGQIGVESFGCSCIFVGR